MYYPEVTSVIEACVESYNAVMSDTSQPTSNQEKSLAGQGQGVTIINNYNNCTINTGAGAAQTAAKPPARAPAPRTPPKHMGGDGDGGYGSD